MSMSEANLNPADYDIVVTISAQGDIAPGSGGVCAYLNDMRTGIQKRVVGGMSAASIQLMDLMAIIAALQYYQDRMRTSDAPRKTLVITANRDLISRAKDAGTADSLEWVLFNWFSKHGYVIDWLWESARSQVLGDGNDVARAVRSTMKDFQCQAQVT